MHHLPETFQFRDQRQRFVGNDFLIDNRQRLLTGPFRNFKILPSFSASLLGQRGSLLKNNLISDDVIVNHVKLWPKLHKSSHKKHVISDYVTIYKQRAVTTFWQKIHKLPPHLKALT